MLVLKHIVLLHLYKTLESGGECVVTESRRVVFWEDWGAGGGVPQGWEDTFQNGGRICYLDFGDDSKGKHTCQNLSNGTH